MTDNSTEVAPAGQCVMELSTMKLFDNPFAYGCTMCQADCRDRYYVINGSLTLCPSCKKRHVTRKLGSPILAFLRSCLFGTAAGLFVAAVSIIILLYTGQLYSMLASLVGFLVGKAVCIASRGRGGWRYEVLAVVISYTCIVVPYAPGMVAPIFITRDPRLKAKLEAAIVPEALDTDEDAVATANEDADGESIIEFPSRLADRPVLAVLAALGIALAVPFLRMPLNWGTWIFIAISLFAAWKLNLHPHCAVAVQGPLRTGG